MVFFAKLNLLSNLLLKYGKGRDTLNLLRATHDSEHWLALRDRSQQFSAERERLSRMATDTSVPLNAEVRKQLQQMMNTK